MGVQSIGMPVRREEDFRLLRGKGRYVDDVRLPREARGYVVRSPHAHARIVVLDAVAARAAPGVFAVLTGDELRERGLVIEQAARELVQQDRHRSYRAARH